MTIKEARARNIVCVCLPEWNEFSYLELPATDERGLSGPCTKLYDPVGTAVLKAFGYKFNWPIPVRWFEWDERSDFIEFTGRKFTPDDIIAGNHVKHVTC